MIDRSRSPSAMLRHVPTFLLATLVAVACSDSPTETTQSDGPADLFAAGLAPGEQNPNSNGQTFVTFGGEGFGFGVVRFPEACFLFNQEPGDLPGSWMRSKPGEEVNMEHTVIKDGFLLVGSFFGGLEGGTAHGTTQVRFDGEGNLQGLTTMIKGRLEDGRKVTCRNHVGKNETIIDQYIEIR